MKPKLSVLVPEDEPAYNAFLLGIEDSLLYYSVRYKSFLQDLLGCEAQYWLAWEGERVTGVLPVMWRDGPYGRILNSLPYYGSNGGVLATFPDASSVLMEKYNELASAPGVAAATWVCHPLRRTDVPPAHTLVDERIGQFTSLDWGQVDVESAMRAAMDGSARRNIRKAETSGVKVLVANDRLDFIRDVHWENMGEIGGKGKTADFFAKVPQHFTAGDDYRVYIAERNGTLISGLLLFYFNRTVEYFTPVTVSNERESQPMALILAQAMVDAAREGFLRWNWGGTWLSQEGVWRFKRKWGAQDHAYQYFIQLNDPALLNCTKSELLRAYPDFFVVPFGNLKTEERANG
ncbi:GNAT family N-acetyltransferase [Nitrospira sp. NS4]|uniref:GNAT family N-acetyltransferase n=1 Tax=Nitrospira sp. NS4 TaxID=3414498 RepID=UPI003C2AF205